MVPEPAVRRPIVVPNPSRSGFVIGLGFSSAAFLLMFLLVDPFGWSSGAGKGPPVDYMEPDLPGVFDTASPDRAIVKAVLWLERHQFDDGSWDARYFFRKCTGSKFSCMHRGDRENNAVLTALSALAILESDLIGPASPFPDAARLRQSCRKALGWLTRQMDDSGCVGPRVGTYMLTHAIASVALSRAILALPDEPDWLPRARRAAEFIANARSPGGAWGPSFRATENTMIVSGWVGAAIQAAREARIEIDKMDPGLEAGIRTWIDSVTDRDSHAIGYVKPVGAAGSHQHKESTTASGLYLLSLLGDGPALPNVRGAATLLFGDLPYWSEGGDTVDFTYWHFGTRALVRLRRGPEWEGPTWTARVLRELLRHQRARADGCAEGSWDPVDPWGAQAGRIYSTAINAVTLSMLRRDLNTVSVRVR